MLGFCLQLLASIQLPGCAETHIGLHPSISAHGRAKAVALAGGILRLTATHRTQLCRRREKNCSQRAFCQTFKPSSSANVPHAIRDACLHRGMTIKPVWKWKRLLRLVRLFSLQLFRVDFAVKYLAQAFSDVIEGRIAPSLPGQSAVDSVN